MPDSDEDSETSTTIVETRLADGTRKVETTVTTTDADGNVLI